ncbi:MAG: BMP family ABC transporter substrate-binding protein [Burkholderiaceae bacterium]|nr:BMP family ABC transporter substrate-binding protein [Burkholderiaceae bacterium]MCD8518156.1 BMP family ABC transporter substrate-binding protein [Burkholderiaceae bacterium]MCD8537741.1 BMP family ABC transporter substrate-binding protein [Burkholderiaceae bacterium]MCD8564160.1 BMP family ABC transporter substrate-binding protein [Burkholderiaceae bacterium]
MKNRRMLFQAGLASLALTAAGFLSSAQAQDPLKVGFVYVSPIGDAGWTYQHDLGRKQMEQALGDKVTTSFVESVPEGADAERVIREMAASGHDLIFATSFGYMNYVDRVSKQFPNVKFMHATGYKSGPNFHNYNARFYEGRYLTGVIAGEMSKSNVLGYIAAFPIPEVLQGINAFTLGAQSVNPNIEVRVIWVNSWYDPGKEREAALALIAQGADVITHHTDSTAAVQAAQEKGVYAVAYHSDMSKYGKDAHLTATTHHWGDYYTRAAQKALNENGMVESIWGGIKDGFIDIAPINPVVPQATQDKVAQLKQQIKDGSFHPFTGPVLAQDGKEVLPAGQTMSDEALGQMNYYVKGVSSKMPN